MAYTCTPNSLTYTILGCTFMPAGKSRSTQRRAVGPIQVNKGRVEEALGGNTAGGIQYRQV